MNDIIKQKKSTVSKASQLLKNMILESYRHHVVKYECGTIIEYRKEEETRNNCPICNANITELHIIFLEGVFYPGGYNGTIYKEGKYE